MKVTYSTETDLDNSLSALSEYRSYVKQVVQEANFTVNESSLATAVDTLMLEGVERVAAVIGVVEHVVLIGIGGSSLGTEAIQAALKGGKKLYVLDTISPHRIKEILEALQTVPKERVTVCVISKSGGTTETLTNASVFLHEYEQLTGNSLHERTVAIGNPGNSLLKTAESLGMQALPMHEVIGGRYSVFTAVGLLPLALLGYSPTEILSGVQQTMEDQFESEAAKGAAHIYQQMRAGVRSVNFFAFDIRLQKLGKWYRQLVAESIGKEFDVDGNPVELGFVPTISTPVELHSVGQLYYSGFTGVFTDIVRSEDLELSYTIPEDSELHPSLAGRSTQEIHEAIYGGVVGAYKERNLPYRITEIDRESQADIGLFMGVRMLETMYLAKLMNVNAFDQPNVELYKDITRNILNS